MNRTKLIFIIAILLLISPESQSEKIQSHWNINNIEIDGQITEWTDAGLNHFEDDNFSIGIRNDSTNLYVLIATRDVRLMNIIYRSGVNLWVNLKSKKKKNFGLKYFSDVEPPKMTELEKRVKDMPEGDKMMQKREELKGKIVLIEDESRRTISNVDPDDYRASSSLYKGTYLLEFKLPYDDGSLLTKLKKNKSRKDIQIGVEIGSDRNQMKRDRPDDSFDGGGGMRGGGGGMRGGSGKGGGMRGGGDRSPMFTKVDQWIKVVLRQEK